MTRNDITLLFVLTMSAVGCVAGDPDPIVVPAKDSGADTASAVDTGAAIDTGSEPIDTGSTVVDTGSTVVDTGTPVMDTSTPCTTSVIDDMEGGEGGIGKVCGRDGYWYTYNDMTVGGMQLPSAGAMFSPTLLPTPRGTSTKAAHTSGSGFTTWGAGMAFDFHSPKGPYDGSSHTGVKFWAKAASSLSLRVNVASRGTDPAGGVCSPADMCNDHFGSTVTVGTDWTELTLTFSSIHQLGWGTPTSFDASKLYSVQFQVDKSTAFDFWIDDVSFTP